MSMRSRLGRMMVAMAFAGAVAACTGGGEQQGGASAPSPAAPAKPTDTADGPGVIAGTMIFDGTPQARRPLPMDADPKCVAESAALSEVLVVGPNKGLQNVFVYVRDGLGNRTYAVPTTTVTLDQRGCRYVPHVFGVQVGQPIIVSNSDPTLHNVNSTPKSNNGFNFGQVPKTPSVPRTFDKPEIGIPFRCDVHPWMNAYAGVVPHPFFAVTKEDGSFEIKGLPTGTYTIEAWHERLGTQTQSVTVDGASPAKVTMSFKSPT